MNETPAQIREALKNISKAEHYPAVKVLAELHYDLTSKSSQDDVHKTVAHMATIILLLALARPKQIEAWIQEHVSYSAAEGFNKQSCGDIDLLLSRIKAQPEYAEVYRNSSD